MFTVDLEEWFQVERLSGVISMKDWENYEMRSQRNTEQLLTLFRESGTKATFFVLGWVAERVPDLILRIKEEGHEIACHGYSHQILFQVSRDEFERDLVKAKRIIEDMTGDSLQGYRAPSFSIVEYVPEVLHRNGFTYDSSLYPISVRGRYGSVNAESIGGRSSICRFGNGLLEVPVGTLKLLGCEFPWGGGGYFRLYPYPVFEKGLQKVRRDKLGFTFYIHPWELDPEQPRVKGLRAKDRLMHYASLSTTIEKVGRLLTSFKFVSVTEGLKRMGLA
jgi:polysaccharide deacetylase family protein (PEP-CTERM system associated)